MIRARLPLQPLVRRLSTSAPPDTAPLVLSPRQLRALLADSPRRIAVLDASWHMPSAQRDAHAEFVAQHIPHARFFDLDRVASAHPLGLKHMIPSPRVFAAACEHLGIAPDAHVVIYDVHGVFSSPRALFTFRALGHRFSSILDGGLPAWRGLGAPVASGPPAPAPRAVYPDPVLDARLLRSYEDMVRNSQRDPAAEDSEIVLDARSHARYTGDAPEPRPGLPSGHIPHALSLPFNTLLESHPAPSPDIPAYTTLAPTAPALLGALPAGRPLVASCGSGMTAALIWLALARRGVDCAIYDESWTGYAMRPESKIATGEETLS